MYCPLCLLFFIFVISSYLDRESFKLIFKVCSRSMPEKKSSPLVTDLKASTPRVYDGDTFQINPISPSINVSIFSCLLQNWAKITSCFLRCISVLISGVFFVCNECCHHQQASSLSVWDHWLHTASQLTPQQPLPSDDGTATAISFSRV